MWVLGKVVQRARKIQHAIPVHGEVVARGGGGGGEKGGGGGGGGGRRGVYF